MGPSFNLTFVEIHTCESLEQCTRPSQKNADTQNASSAAIQTQIKCAFGMSWIF